MPPDPFEEPEVSGQDPVAVVAVGLGLLGIVVLGIVLAIVTAVLGGLAGQRAKESGRSLDLPYLALILAAVDGVAWLVLHFLFELPVAAG